ncbi:MAG: flagellar motor switch protein FliN [Fimbriimonadaceae bacterium]
MTQLFAQLQSALWTSVARSVTDHGGPTVGIVPLDVVEPDTDSLLQELAAPSVVATFNLSSGGSGIVCVPEATSAAFGQENTPESWGSLIEAIVSGACAGLADPSTVTVTPSNINATGPMTELPEEFAEQGAFIRMVAKATGDGGSGTLTLVLDHEACSNLTGEPSSGTVAPKSMEGVTSDLGLLFDVPLELSVEIGRVKIPVRDVVDLGAGSIVEIDKAAGEPVEVLLNGHLVAKGEVVVIDDNFGVRITEILKPADRKSSEAA